MRKLTSTEQAAKDDFDAKQEIYFAAGDVLVEAFNGYWEFLDKNDFLGAKEFLRPMPDSSQKVLAFHNIIVREKTYNEKLTNNSEENS